MMEDMSPGRAHHREHIKNIDNSIINIKPDNTHLIKVSNYHYKQLQKIGETNPLSTNETDMEDVISFLIRYFYITQIMMQEQETYEEVEKRLLFGNKKEQEKLLL